MKEEKFEEYLNIFKEKFSINNIKNINYNNMKLLDKLFCDWNNEIYALDKKQLNLLKERNKIIEKLFDTFSEEQKRMFNKQSEIQNQLATNMDKQLFIFGYIVANELNNEARI